MFSRFFTAALLFLLATSAHAQAMRDPTRPLEFVASEQAEAPLELNSILISEDRRIAVINGQRAAEREQIGNVYVLRILPNRVIVRRNGQQIELTLHNPITRRDAS